MAPVLTQIETPRERRLSPQQIFAAAAAHETSLSRLLILYITTGLMFVLVPGTFLGLSLLLLPWVDVRRAVFAFWGMPVAGGRGNSGVPGPLEFRLVVVARIGDL